MPNTFRRDATGSATYSLRKGNLYMGVGDVERGPTTTTFFYNGVVLGTFSYVLALRRGNFSVPTFYQIQDDTELINMTNRIDTSSTRTTINECFAYYADQQDRLVINKEYPTISTNGLILNLDAGFLPSYPATASTWYDTSITQINGTLTNSPTFSTSGWISTDDTGDSHILLTTSWSSQNWSISIMVRLRQTEKYFMRLAGAGSYIQWFLNTNRSLIVTYSKVTPVVEATIASANSAVSLDTWYEFLVTISSSGNSFLYRNGHQIATGTWTVGTIQPFQIFIGGVDGTNTTNCDVSTVRVYDRVLSSSEIVQNHYHGSIVTSGLVLAVDPSKLISYSDLSTSWIDMGTWSNNGTLQNTPTFRTKYNGYLEFDGNNDYADFTFNGRSSTANTVEMFVRWRSGSGGMFVGFTSYDIYTYGAALGFNTGVGDLWGISSTRVTQLNLIGTSNSNWHHYVFVFTSQVQNNKIYIDGNIETLSQQRGNTNTTTTRTFDATLRISGWLNSTNYVLAGDYSFIRVYNRELSSSEISQNFAAHKSRFGI
jgi:hypothetical protein